MRRPSPSRSRALPISRSLVLPRAVALLGGLTAAACSAASVSAPRAEATSAEATSASSTPTSTASAPVATLAVKANASKPDDIDPLERALATIDAREIRSDVFFLADDRLEGRDTPSRGLEIAARYIRARLERLGWAPGAKDGFFYTYPLTQRRLDVEHCSAQITAGGNVHSLVLGTDYFLGNSMDVFESKLDAPMVWCGAASAKELKDLKIDGKWAVCEDAGQSGMRLARDVREAGAAGLVLVETKEPKEPYALRFGRALDELRHGNVQFPRKESAEGAAGEGDRRPTQRSARVYLARVAFERVLAALGKQSDGLKPGDELGATLAETRAMDGSGELQVENVCGFWRGSDPELSKDVIIISAHYDHVGINRGQVYNGADDNGSGSSGLLALAEALAVHGPMKRSVLLMWMSGEEKGLWGSRAWNDNPWLPEGCRPLCDINIDMIGRNAPDKLLITPTEKRSEFNGLVKLAQKLAPLEGFPQLGSADEYYERSDHYNFAKKGMPVAFLFSDVHEDYHKPTDDPEKVDTNKIERVTRLVLRMVDGLQEPKIEL